MKAIFGEGAEKESKEERKKMEGKKGQEGEEATRHGGARCVDDVGPDCSYQRTGWGEKE